MSVPSLDGPAPGPARTINDDVQRAEALLFDLAVLLRYVPLGDHTRELHLRALHLKREVRQWAVQPPAPSRLDDVFDELAELRTEAAAWLRRGRHHEAGTT